MSWCWAMLLTWAGAAFAADPGLQRFLQTGELAGWTATGRERSSQLLRQGQVARAAGDTAAARTALEQLTRAGGGFWTAAAWGVLAEMALHEGRLDEAGRCLEQVRRQTPQAAGWTRLRQAELLYFQGQFAPALTQLEELARQNPGDLCANDALELLTLIEGYQDQGEALQVLARAQLHLRQGRPADAEWAALETSGKLQDLSLLLQARSLAPSDPAAALHLYQRLAEQFPKSPQAATAQLEAAGLLAAGGRRGEALAQYEKALSLFPEDARMPEVRLQIQRLRRQGGEQ